VTAIGGTRYHGRSHSTVRASRPGRGKLALIFKNRFENAIEMVVLSAAALVLAAGGGLLVTIGNLDLAVIVLIVLAGMVALLRPALSLYILVCAGLLLVGFFKLYLPGMEKVQWGVAGLATILGAIGVLGVLFNPKPGLDIPPNSGMLCILLLLICMSAIVNVQSAGMFLYGFKGYAQVMGLFFAISLLALPPGIIDALPRLVIAIAVIQLPFVMHQWFVLVPARVTMGSGVVAEDVVAGTMGADVTGGGSNAVLSLLLITAISIVAAGYKRGQIKPLISALISIVCSIPLFLNANRIALLYLLLVFLIIFGPSMFRRMSRFLTSAILTAIVVSGAISVQLNYGSRSGEFVDWQDLVTKTIERNTIAEAGYGAFELNRMASITFWWSEQFRKQNPRTFLFGNGPGAAREASASSIGVNTLANTRYPGMGIGLTGISSILWELGLVGLIAVCGLFYRAFHSAHFLVTHAVDNPYRQYVAEGLQVVVIVFFISLFHKSTFVFHITYQTLLYLIFGILSVWHFSYLQRENRRTRADTEFAIDAAP
jgi:hypothetical protein